LDEFNEAEEVVRGLVDEYAAAERQDYIEWGEEEEKGGDDRMNYEGGESSSDKNLKFL
jgi:hypothetical protein